MVVIDTCVFADHVHVHVYNCFSLQRLSYTCTASSVPSGDVSASQCVPEDITFFTQRPWTDMMKDLDLAGKTAVQAQCTVA